MTLNIFRGIDQNTPTDERKKIMGINAYVLKKTGLVSKNKEDKIVYPPIFQVTDQGGAKILYKLKYLQKGTFIKEDKNTGAIIPDTKYTLDADTQNLYAEEMIGLGAVYQEVSPILDKAIVPWFWQLNELDTFIEFSKLQQPQEVSAVSRVAEESAPQLNAQEQAILDRLSSIGLPQTREEVAAATPVVTATPTKEESGTVSSDSLLGGMAGLRQKMKEKGVSEAVKDRVRNMGSKLKPSDTMESKSSAKQPINQAALTNILDKLALKFGISWRYDSSIPGLGQFKDGEVLINPDKAKADTPFHEFAHPFIAIVKIQNPYLYNNLMNQLTKSDVGIKTLEKVKKLYPELTYEQQIEEAIVDVIGQYAADAQSIKKEKGLWNAIKTFLRRVSEYIKSLLNDSQKKIVPSELDPNTTMKELASMLVIDNPIDLGPLLSRSYKKTTTIKPGVSELFESTPELANAVYEIVNPIQDAYRPEGYEGYDLRTSEVRKYHEQQALQLYSQYLDTVFPDSKVKDIVYHGTEDKFDKFDIKYFGKNDYGDLGKGFYFAFDKASIFNEPIVISAIVNDIEAKTSPGYEIMIPKSEQIHILGNKQDIEGFKEFANQSTRPQLNNVSTLFNTFANVSDADVLELINECN